MMMDRDALIAAGWTPPEGDPDYEAWRPALKVFRAHYDGPHVATPMDSVDRDTVDLLRGVVRAAPPPDLAKIKRAIEGAMEDSLKGEPAGSILVKGCAAADYIDPTDAAEGFVTAAAQAVADLLRRP